MGLNVPPFATPALRSHLHTSPTPPADAIVARWIMFTGNVEESEREEAGVGGGQVTKNRRAQSVFTSCFGSLCVQPSNREYLVLGHKYCTSESGCDGIELPHTSRAACLNCSDLPDLNLVTPTTSCTCSVKVLLLYEAVRSRFYKLHLLEQKD